MEKKKILVVDDEMDMRIFMKTLFETGGYLPTIAKNGKEGLEKAKTISPDLIVLDVMMPGEGGVYMYRELRSDENLKKIPVIMLSGVGKKSFFHYLKMLNIRIEDQVIPEPEAYLEKPPDPGELLKIARSILEKNP